jgi:fatty-acyl-CoA synthase
MPLPSSRTLPDLLDELAGRYPDHVFLIDGDRRFTYAEFRAETRHLARSFYALGVRRGDRVAILMGNRAEWLLVDFAVTMLGAVLVALNTWWRQRELHHALHLTGASVLVMASRYLKHDYVSELAGMSELPELRHVVCLGDTRPPGALPYSELRRMGDDVSDAALDTAQRAVRSDDMAYLLFTSGSTARSKAVPLLHGGLIGNMHGIGERLHLTEQDRLLMVVSLFWSFGCANALFAMITHGGSVVLQDSFDTGRSLELIEGERCTVLYAMPNMALAMQTHPDRARRDLSSLRTGITLPQSVKLMASIGVPEITSCYGLTEGYGNSMVTDCKAPLERRAEISGTALPGNEVEIVDPTTRAPLPVGEAGEIRIRGFVTPGYYRDEATTRAATDNAGWFYTGDLARLDAEGGLHFVSRIKELVKTGGINVAPAEVEEILEAHPAVRHAVVVGLTDPEREEILAALVVLHDGAQATPEELTRHCRAQAAAFKVPRRIMLVGAAEVPLTDTGKISKRGVQALLSASDHAA